MRKSKEKVLKRVCTLALSAALVAGSIAQLPNGLKSKVESVSAGDGYDGIFTYGGREFHYLNNGNDLTLVYAMGSGDITVPSEVKINGKIRKITRLQYPFGHLQKASKFIIPDSVTTIGDCVFTESTIDYIKLPNTLKSIGANFCEKTTLGNLVCSSKKVTLGANPFNGSTIKAKKLIINDWLIRYTPDNKILDLNNYELKNIKHVVPGAVSYSDKVTVLQIGKNETLLDPKYFAGESKNYIKEVYTTDGKVVCKNANDTVPDVIKRNYDFFLYSAFDKEYAFAKAKLVLEKLGIKYYGPNSKDKGKLSAAKEYDIAYKLHNYIVDNYTYSTSANGLYTKVFNCHTVTKCCYDAQMYAFLLECAGVDAETAYSSEYIKVTKEQKEKEPNASYFEYKNVLYKVQNSGNHAWTLLKIGGNWYHADATEDRSLGKDKSLTQFLISDDYLLDTAHAKEKPAHSDLGLHGYPHRSVYFYNEDYYFFQDKNHMFDETNYHIMHGDVDGDLYRTKKDRDYIQAYAMLSDKYRNILKKVAAKSYKPTSAEINIINGCKIYGRNITFIDSKGNCTVNVNAFDINFDGKTDMSDLTAYINRVSKEKYYKEKFPDMK